MYKLCSVLYVLHINGLYIYMERERAYKCALYIICVQYVHMVTSSFLDTAVINSVIAIILPQWENSCKFF